MDGFEIKVLSARYAPGTLPATLPAAAPCAARSLTWRPPRAQESGLTRTPEQSHSARNVRETLVKIDQIGRGASGVVHRALHVPSMRLVAVKEIPVFEQEKRRQMIKEVKALYSNLAAIDGASWHTAPGAQALNRPFPVPSGRGEPAEQPVPVHCVVLRRVHRPEGQLCVYRGGVHGRRLAGGHCANWWLCGGERAR